MITITTITPSTTSTITITITSTMTSTITTSVRSALQNDGCAVSPSAKVGRFVCIYINK